MRRHHVASWLQHWELRHLTQHQPSTSEVLFVATAYGIDRIRHYKCMGRTTTFLICCTFRNTIQLQSKYYCQLHRRFYTLTCLHFSVVMSSWRVTTFGMGLMGTKSTPEQKDAIINVFLFFFSLTAFTLVGSGEGDSAYPSCIQERGRVHPWMGQAHRRALSKHLEVQCLA